MIFRLEKELTEEKVKFETLKKSFEAKSHLMKALEHKSPSKALAEQVEELHFENSKLKDTVKELSQ